MVARGETRGTASAARPQVATGLNRSAGDERRITPKVWLLSLAFAVAALVVRVLFWQATADAPWPYSASYRGDATVWLEWANAIVQQHPFELGLPFRPPGTAYLVAVVMSCFSEQAFALRLAWCALGALVVMLTFLAAYRQLGLEVACVTGTLVSISTGLIILSNSVNSETPYLVVLMLSFLVGTFLPQKAGPGPLVLWGALHAVACLFRPEHVVLFVLLLAHQVWQIRGKQSVSKVAFTALGGFALTLAPWQIHAALAVRSFNTQRPARSASEAAILAEVDRRMAGMTWQPEARERLDQMPAFARDRARQFVAATVLTRGGLTVRLENLDILEEAFGYRPEPLSTTSFVALYGPLNFALANHDRAKAWFDRALLEAKPPLEGGGARYSAELVRGLPPADLELFYPPHLLLVNHGYRVGMTWIIGHPFEFVSLAGGKLALFWRGAALGVTGYGFPLGSGGVRWPVDLALPMVNVVSVTLQIGLLLALAATAFAGHRAAIIPWFLLIASKAATCALFFGYGRMGATVTPALAVLVAVVCWRCAGHTRTGRGPTTTLLPALSGLVLIAGIATEAFRCHRRPQVLVDGTSISATAPQSAGEHQLRLVEYR